MYEDNCKSSSGNAKHLSKGEILLEEDEGDILFRKRYSLFGLKATVAASSGTETSWYWKLGLNWKL